MKNIDSVAEHYPIYVHRYYVAMCEIDGCENNPRGLFLMPNGEGVPLCSSHAREYLIKAKGVGGGTLADKKWSIVL